jgi:rhodanese-related sulfurtransferase
MVETNGEISALQSWRILQENKDAILIDVRTLEECIFVGTPWLEGINRKFVHIPWRLSPNMDFNSHFPEELIKHADQKATLLFICRSGGRSREAAKAAKELGYQTCYNIADGFEGNLDSDYHRGNLNGWKAANLPWRQS